jgi:hypothetical protein
MERITKQIDTLNNGARHKGKIFCRNSYERNVAHKYAEEKGLSHRSIPIQIIITIYVTNHFGDRWYNINIQKLKNYHLNVNRGRIFI